MRPSASRCSSRSSDRWLRSSSAASSRHLVSVASRPPRQRRCRRAWIAASITCGKRPRATQFPQRDGPLTAAMRCLQSAPPVGCPEEEAMPSYEEKRAELHLAALEYHEFPTP